MMRARFGLDRVDALLGVLAVASVAGFVIASALINKVGFPLDDAWIHQTYARNLAEHGEWAFVPGQTSVASTSPLYTLLLSVGYVLRIPFFVWTFVLGALALAGASWLGRRLGAQLFPDYAGVGLWSGLAMISAWHLVWAAASGMETMLFSTLSLAVVWLGWREVDQSEQNDGLSSAFRRGLMLGLVGAALTLTRPEGVGLVGLTGLSVLLAWPYADVRSGGRVYLAWALGVASAWLIGVLPYLILNYDVSGTLLPDTSRAKQAEYAYLREQWSLFERYLQLSLPLLASGLIVLVPGVLYGVYDLVRRVRSDRRQLAFWLPVVWASVVLTAYALRLPANYQHGRYVIPILPHVLLVGVGSTLGIMRVWRHNRIQRVASRTLALSAALIIVGFWFLGAQAYGRDVRIINTEMVDTAHWIEENVPADDLLAVHDIGAVGYYAPRTIFDLAGLVSPEVVPVIDDPEALMQMMCERGVRYLMVFPDQRPAAATDSRLGDELIYDDELGQDVVKPLFKTNAPYAPEAGGTNMLVYQMNWSACHE